MDGTAIEIANEEGHTVGLRLQNASEGAPDPEAVIGRLNLPRGSAVVAENGSLKEIAAEIVIGSVIEKVTKGMIREMVQVQVNLRGRNHQTRIGRGQNPKRKL